MLIAKTPIKIVVFNNGAYGASLCHHGSNNPPDIKSFIDHKLSIDFIIWLDNII